MLPTGGRPVTSSVHYTTSCNTQSSVPEDGQNNCPKHAELTGIINKSLLLHLVGWLYYLYQWCTVKKMSYNEIYLLIKYIKSVLWRVVKGLSYIKDARCLKVNYFVNNAWYIRRCFLKFAVKPFHLQAVWNTRVQCILLPQKFYMSRKLSDL